MLAASACKERSARSDAIDLLWFACRFVIDHFGAVVPDDVVPLVPLGFRLGLFGGLGLSPTSGRRAASPRTRSRKSAWAPPLSGGRVAAARAAGGPRLSFR